MNIFVLHTDPKLAAEYHCDKHCIKMILEQTQLLHTSLHCIGLKESWMYKPFNPKHPSCLWTRESKNNYKWVLELGYNLVKQYKERYGGKSHKCEEKLDLASRYIDMFPDIPQTKFRLAMPQQFHTDDAVHSYKLYYSGAKFRFTTWKNGTPDWWEQYRKIVKENNLEVANDKDDGVILKTS